MPREEIEIIIEEDGEVKVHVRGVRGARCLDFTKWLEEELGTVTGRTKTTEYYEQQTVKPTVRVKG